MCQLFGISSQQQIAPSLLLADFFQRGGTTAEHRDGWGIASFDVSGELFLEKSIQPASQCVKAQHYLAASRQTQTLVAHIRKATFGNTHLANTHPFTQQLWGQQWVFCHNGDLHDFHAVPDKRFHPKGQTDSERAFYVLLSKLSRQFPGSQPSLPQFITALKQYSDEIAQFGSFNYLLVAHQYLYVYASTELYWTERNLPQTRVALVDSDRDISTEIARQNQVVVVATKPLTKGEIWYPMGKGELRVFSRGRLLHHVFDPARFGQSARQASGSETPWYLI